MPRPGKLDDLRWGSTHVFQGFFSLGEGYDPVFASQHPGLRAANSGYGLPGQIYALLVILNEVLGHESVTKCLSPLCSQFSLAILVEIFCGMNTFAICFGKQVLAQGLQRCGQTDDGFGIEFIGHSQSQSSAQAITKDGHGRIWALERFVAPPNGLGPITP